MEGPEDGIGPFGVLGGAAIALSYLLLYLNSSDRKAFKRLKRERIRDVEDPESVESDQGSAHFALQRVSIADKHGDSAHSREITRAASVAPRSNDPKSKLDQASKRQVRLPTVVMCCEKGTLTARERGRIEAIETAARCLGLEHVWAHSVAHNSTSTASTVRKLAKIARREMRQAEKRRLLETSGDDCNSSILPPEGRVRASSSASTASVSTASTSSLPGSVEATRDTHGVRMLLPEGTEEQPAAVKGRRGSRRTHSCDDIEASGALVPSGRPSSRLRNTTRGRKGDRRLVEIVGDVSVHCSREVHSAGGNASSDTSVESGVLVPARAGEEVGKCEDEELLLTGWLVWNTMGESRKGKDRVKGREMRIQDPVSQQSASPMCTELAKRYPQSSRLLPHAAFQSSVIQTAALVGKSLLGSTAGGVLARLPRGMHKHAAVLLSEHELRAQLLQDFVVDVHLHSQARRGASALETAAGSPMSTARSNDNTSSSRTSARSSRPRTAFTTAMTPVPHRGSISHPLYCASDSMLLTTLLLRFLDAFVMEIPDHLLLLGAYVPGHRDPFEGGRRRCSSDCSNDSSMGVRSRGSRSGSSARSFDAAAAARDAEVVEEPRLEGCDANAVGVDRDATTKEGVGGRVAAADADADADAEERHLYNFLVRSFDVHTLVMLRGGLL